MATVRSITWVGMACSALALAVALPIAPAASGQRLPKPKQRADRWYVVDRDDGVVVSAMTRSNESLPLFRGWVEYR